MTHPLSLQAEARAEIDEAYRWYEEQRPGLGEEFLTAVRQTLHEVEDAPLRYPRIRSEIRRALLARFPYSILYLVEPRATVVVACFHSSRNPRRWHERVDDRAR